MRTRAAVLHSAPGKWQIEEVDIEEPRQDELKVRMVASGLCHSDDHIATADVPIAYYPIAGGHEGAGVVEEVGPNTAGYEVGDHVVVTFIPVCGRCRWCATGHQNLCDSGAFMFEGTRLDGSYRMHLDGKPVNQMAGISTFSAWSTVSTQSVVKIPADIPLDRACLTACGVATGWGSAVNFAEVRPGDCVIVMGVGGVGINAVQGAAYAGASQVVAVDPVEFKRETALRLGATHAVSSMDDALALVQPFTNGQGADSCVICVGVTDGSHIAEGFDAIRKGGICVVTGVGKMLKKGIPISPWMMTNFQKRIQGALFGACNPTRDIPLLLELYQQGGLKLDEIVTATYTLDEINDGYADMLAGKVMRSVLLHEH